MVIVVVGKDWIRTSSLAYIGSCRHCGGWLVSEWDDANLLWGMLFVSFSGCKWKGFELD